MNLPDGFPREPDKRFGVTVEGFRCSLGHVWISRVETTEVEIVEVDRCPTCGFRDVDESRKTLARLADEISTFDRRILLTHVREGR